MKLVENIFVSLETETRENIKLKQDKETIKGTVNEVSCDPSGKYGSARFTAVPLKPFRYLNLFENTLHLEQDSE